MNFRIESDYNKISKEHWLDFVVDHEKGNIFQSHYIYDIYSSTEEYEPFVFALYDESEKLVGILTGTIISYFNIKNVFTSRSIISGGPIVKNNDQELISLLLDAYIKEKSKKILFTEIRNFYSQLNENDAFQKMNFRFESHLNYLIDLSIPKDEIWSKINRSKRKGINKAEREGILFSEIDIRDIAKLTESYGVIEDVYNRARLPYPKKDLFINAAKESNDNYGLKIFSVSKDDKIIGVRFALVFKDYIYGWYAGSYSEFYKYFPNELLAWKTLEWGNQKGYKVFDYGGAGKPNIPYGVRDFKSKFGGELVNYGRYNNIHHPAVFSLSKIGFKLLRTVR